MSEEKEEYNPANVKCLSLSSGLLVIGYVREVTDFGAYVVERPMNVFEEEDEVDGKTYMGLMPYNPLATKMFTTFSHLASLPYRT